MLPRHGMIFLLTGMVMIVLPFAAARQAEAMRPPAPRDLALVDTITWGPNQSTMTAFLALGREKWLQSQLHPASEGSLPKAVQQQIDALAVSRKSAFELAADFDALGRVASEVTDPAQKVAVQNISQDGMSDIARQAATVSILRALYSPNQLLAYDDKVIVNTVPVQNWFNRLAEGLYNHQTPDGYAMVSSAWDSSGQMMARFEIARQIGSGSSGLFKAAGPNAVDEPAYPLLQNSLYFDGLQAGLSVQTRAALDKASSPQDWNTIFLSSPEFMR